MSINDHVHYDLRVHDDEYKTTYYDSDFYKNTTFDSRTYENWLTDEELNIFEQAAYTSDVEYTHDTSMAPMSARLKIGQETTAHYYKFGNFYSNPIWKPLVDIIQPKLEATFGKDIKASYIHVLHSLFPYGLHNDAEQPNIVLAPEPAWTLIIPLRDYPSKTYVFNERSNVKNPRLWAEKNNIQPSDHCISPEVYEKDFAPIADYDIFRYLTVETTFQWKRGSCFAADRFKYHCIDNYFNHDIKGKKAIIMWTSK
jgi:hypothetical protein